MQSRHPEGIKLVTSEDFENLKSATDEDKALWKKKPYQWRDQKHKDGKNWLSRWKDGAQGKDENWLSYDAVRKRVNRLINPK